MDRNFWDITNIYRQNIKNDNNDQPVKIPNCINDDFCIEPPKDIGNGVLTMVFGNMQPLENIYSAESALKNGTLFPCLDKNFYGGMKK